MKCAESIRVNPTKGNLKGKGPVLRWFQGKKKAEQEVLVVVSTLWSYVQHFTTSACTRDTGQRYFTVGSEVDLVVVVYIAEGKSFFWTFGTSVESDEGTKLDHS